MSELIDVLLDESDFADDAGLRDLLDELEREATAVRPIASAALSELMAPRRTPTRRPSFARRGVVITGIAVIGALGLGAGAAAASPEARAAIGAGVAVIAHLFDPGAPALVSVPILGIDGSSGSSGSPEPSSSGAPTVQPSDTPSPSDGTNSGATDDPTPEATSNAQSGDDSGDSSGDSNSNGKHGNGKGNHSGHGNGKGQGNGGPAPTP